MSNIDPKKNMFFFVVLYCVQLLSENVIFTCFSFFMSNMFVVVVLYCVQLLSEDFFLFKLFYFFMINIGPIFFCCGGPLLSPAFFWK